MFKGSLVALITPFRDGAVDDKAFQEHVAWQLGQGTHGLVPIGTTGECPALEDEEQERLIEMTVEVANGRVPVIPGTGFNSTAHTIHATKVAKKAGADAALVVCPYYNKPTQEGLYQHFKAVHDAADIPIVIYNIPGRSSVDMSNATMARLAKLPNIIGVKDATNDLARPLRMRVEIDGDTTRQATIVKVLKIDEARFASRRNDAVIGENATSIDAPVADTGADAEPAPIIRTASHRQIGRQSAAGVCFRRSTGEAPIGTEPESKAIVDREEVGVFV